MTERCQAIDEQCAYVLEFLPCTCGDPHCVHIPHFTASPIAARLLEDEIERRGLPMEYMRALLHECPVMGYADIDNPEDANAWTMLRATPAQRARAFLAVVT